MRKTLTLAALLTLLFAAGTGIALAQDTTVPPATSTTAAPTTLTQDSGAHKQGDSFVIASCGFSTGVTLTFDGQAAGTDTIAEDGCARQTVVVTEDGLAMGSRFAVAGLELAAPTPAVTIDGRAFTARSGSNTLTNTGIGTNGATRTVNTTFTLGSTTSGGGTALARTGGMILRWSLAAVALMAVGTLLVLADRRRKVAPVRDEWSTKL